MDVLKFLIRTWDPERGVIEGKVEAAFVTHPSELAALTFGEPGQEQTIQTTWNHPFYVVELVDFVDVSALEPGQHLLSETGHAIPIQSIEPIRGPPTNQAESSPNASDWSAKKTGPNADPQAKPPTYTTYNFSVQTTHTYFVQQTQTNPNAALVHNQSNTKCVPPLPKGIGGTGAKYNKSKGQGLYVLVDGSNQVKYVGRGDAPARLLSHANSKGKKGLRGIILLQNNLTKDQAKNLEQGWIEFFGGAKSTNPLTNLLNKIRSYSPINPNASKYDVGAADALIEETLKKLGYL